MTEYRMTTAIPASITTPDSVDTHIGTLEFFDGYPSEETAQRCVDNLLLLRGVEVFKFLNISQLQRLQDVLSEVKCDKGKEVISQGEPGKEFYIIMEGEAAVTVKDGAEVREVRGHHLPRRRALALFSPLPPARAPPMHALSPGDEAQAVRLFRRARLAQ